MKSFDQHLQSIQKEYLRESRFHVTGEIVFVDPYGTGRKHFRVDSVINASTANQAVFLAAKNIAKERKMRNSYYYPGQGYRIQQIPDDPPKQTWLPYRDD